MNKENNLKPCDIKEETIVINDNIFHIKVFFDNTKSSIIDNLLILLTNEIEERDD